MHSDASASGTGFVITHLTKGSNNYIAIVSHDPYNEQDITLSFVSGSNWKEITFGNPSDFEKKHAADRVWNHGSRIREHFKKTETG